MRWCNTSAITGKPLARMTNGLPGARGARQATCRRSCQPRDGRLQQAGLPAQKLTLTTPDNPVTEQLSTPPSNLQLPSTVASRGGLGSHADTSQVCVLSADSSRVHESPKTSLRPR